MGPSLLEVSTGAMEMKMDLLGLLTRVFLAQSFLGEQQKCINVIRFKIDLLQLYFVCRCIFVINFCYFLKLLFKII